MWRWRRLGFLAVVCLALLALISLLLPRDPPDHPPAAAQDPVEDRRSHLEATCATEPEAGYRTVWRVASNRDRNGDPQDCDAKLCPVVVDKKNLLYVCFVPKAGSTALKHALLALHGTLLPTDNSTAFHIEANRRLKRVSPMFFPQSVTKRYLRIVVVRHPFARLASVYRDKVLSPRGQIAYFYDKYWNHLMRRLGSDSVSFSQFVEYLLSHDPIFYDVHWTPVWSRCEPCLAHYDVVVKLETARRDLGHLARLTNLTGLASALTDRPYKPSDKELFRQISAKQIQGLYDIFRLDFLIFNYTTAEFLGPLNPANLV